MNASTKAAELKKALQQSKAEESHLFMKSPSAESLKGRIENWANKIKKLEVRLFLSNGQMMKIIERCHDFLLGTCTILFLFAIFPWNPRYGSFLLCLVLFL